MSARKTNWEAGFTLVEAVIVIAISGIVAAVVAVFIRAPVESYLDLNTRAELTDIADTAVRRMARDVRLALPNSIRSPNAQCFEYLATSTGGRYRTDTPGNVLDFSAGSTSFDVLGSLDPVPVANDQVVVYNLGIDGANAYAGDNRAAVSGATTSSISLGAAFPTTTLASPGNRFHIVPASERAVFYVCVNPGISASGNGTGTLYRRSAYGINAAVPASCPAIPAGTPMLAQNISACDFVYASGVTQRSDLISLRLAVTRDNETVTLQHDVHVNNTP